MGYILNEFGQDMLADQILAHVARPDWVIPEGWFADAEARADAGDWQIEISAQFTATKTPAIIQLSRDWFSQVDDE